MDVVRDLLTDKIRGTYMQAILRIGISANFWFRLMLSPLMRKTGRIAKLKSHIAKIADITYVKAMMMSIVMHVPVDPSARFQKKSTGLH